jgi:pimeloyl-ACP methyl ester carboxylesterase
VIYVTFLVPLRNSATQMTYFDKATYATDESVQVGRLHCLQEGWDNAMISFMQSGGFSPSKLVPQVAVPTLVVWGRQDGVLNGQEFAPKFIATIPKSRLQWIDECGHVPHLEQANILVSMLHDFVSFHFLSLTL